MAYIPRRRLDRRGDGAIRYIIAIVIAIIGFFGYYFGTEINPVTGEEQRVALSPKEEVALGLQAAPELAAQMGGLVPESDPRARLVDAVGQRLVEQLPAETPWRFEFHLLADPNTINAFALPGGQIFITLGLYQALENEAQLAGVLGHEIGHVVHRHAAEHMATGSLGQMLATAAGVAASQEGGGQQAYAVAQVVNQLTQLKYGRDDELESDVYGLQYLAAAGYDPRAMTHVMRVLKQAGGGGGPEFLASHPHPEARLEAIERYLAEQYPSGVPETLTTGRRL